MPLKNNPAQRDRNVSDKEVNPYLDARREWNERYGDYIQRARNWRLVAVGLTCICLVQGAGLVGLALQNKLVPYIVQVDRLGTAVPVARADTMEKADERVVKALLARWVSDARGVVSDGIAQRQMIDRVYSMLANGTRALSIVNEFYKADPPTAKGATTGVSVEVSSVLPLTDKTWQIEWEETVRNTTGGMVSRSRWKATVTLAFNAPTSERQLRANPVGVYITDLNWSQVI